VAFTREDSLLQAELQDFLFAEAEVLDEHRYLDWLNQFVSKDIRYRMPVQVTRDRRNAASASLPSMMHIDDDWDVLELRVLRFETEYAWAEDPPSRTRHLVSNVRPVGRVDTAEVQVHSNLLLYRTRGDKPAFDLLSAARHDTVRPDGDGWRLVERLVLLDQSVVLTHNLAVIL
jgi:3-phenylpropionate/cinnamic acid dioxygenase small subunit